MAAAKICILETEDELEDFMVEIDILSEMCHENVIKLYEAYYHLDKLWVIEISVVADYRLTSSAVLSTSVNYSQLRETVNSLLC